MTFDECGAVEGAL
jgi:hypothetical protein